MYEPDPPPRHAHSTICKLSLTPHSTRATTLSIPALSDARTSVSYPPILWNSYHTVAQSACIVTLDIPMLSLEPSSFSRCPVIAGLASGVIKRLAGLRPFSAFRSLSLGCPDEEYPFYALMIPSASIWEVLEWRTHILRNSLIGNSSGRRH